MHNCTGLCLKATIHSKKQKTRITIEISAAACEILTSMYSYSNNTHCERKSCTVLVVLKLHGDIFKVAPMSSATSYAELYLLRCGISQK